mmetsp:Transcript_9130/g.14053  ORF Transcript_9130/g.14053 Transcript_9130/m.14053 type:complete len:398 (-) Transcript_9130:1944-3137(-)
MSRHEVIESRLFLLALANHIIWSSLSVAGRYLQVYSQPKVFDGQGVLATGKATSAILVFTCSQTFCLEQNKNTNQQDDTNDNCSTNVDLVDEDKQQKSSTSQLVPIRTKLFFALLFGVVATCRAALNIASCNFTLSYYITAVNSLSPLVVSVGDKVWLKTDLPSAIWPCIFASIIGCATIALSQSPLFLKLNCNNRNPYDGNGSINSYSFGFQDVLGCGLQLLSVCFSAVARLLMKRTEHILNRNEAIQANNICNCIFPLLYTLITNPQGWEAFDTMNLPSFGAWSTIAVLVYTIGSTGQMSLVRSMGPGMYSSLSATRVLGAALLSAIWLHEPVQNWLEWIGLFVIMGTMTLYTLASVDVRFSWSHCLCSAPDNDDNDAGSDEKIQLVSSGEKPDA